MPRHRACHGFGQWNRSQSEDDLPQCHQASSAHLHSSCTFLGHLGEQNAHPEKHQLQLPRLIGLAGVIGLVANEELSLELLHYQANSHCPLPTCPRVSPVSVPKHGSAPARHFGGAGQMNISAKLSATSDGCRKSCRTAGRVKALGRKGKAEHAIAYCCILDINMLGRKQCNTQELAHFLEFWGLGNPLDFFYWISQKLHELPNLIFPVIQLILTVIQLK